MVKLNKEALLKAIATQQVYGEQVTPFLQAVLQKKTQIYPIINQTVLEVLKSLNLPPITKLMGLRLFKDAFIQGNINFIDDIDDRIVQQIYEIAAFNANFQPSKANKKQGRGDLYFIQIQKRNKDSKIMKFGNSYVAFATQVIFGLANIYPKQFSTGQASLLDEASQNLLKMGVKVPSPRYFTEQDQEQFVQNAKNWLKQHKKAERQSKHSKKSEKSVKQQPQYKEDKQSKQPLQPKEHESKVKKVDQQPCFILPNNDKQPQSNKTNAKKTTHNLQMPQKQDVKQSEANKQQIITQNKKNPFILQTADAQKLTKLLNQQHISQKKIQQLNWVAYNYQISNSSTIKQHIKCLQGDHIIIQQKVLPKVKQPQILKQFEKKVPQKQIETPKISQNLKPDIKVSEKLIKQQIVVQKQVDKKQKKRIDQQKQKRKDQSQQKQRLNKIIAEQQLKILTLELKVTQITEANQKYMKSIQQKITEMSLKKIQEPQIVSFRDPNQKQNEPVAPKKQSNAVSNVSKVNYHKMGNLKTQNSLKQLSRIRSRSPNQFGRTNTQNYHAFSANDNTIFEKSCIKLNKNKGQNYPQKIYPQIKDYFAPLTSEKSSQFRSCCFLHKKQSAIFFQDRGIEMKIHKNQRYEHQIIIQNNSNTQIQLKMICETKQFELTPKSKQTISPSQISIFNIEGHLINFNFRYPILNIAISKNNEQIIYRIPVPITLLSFTTFSSKKNQRCEIISNNQQQLSSNSKQNYGTIIHKSQQFILGANNRNLRKIFPQLVFTQDDKLEGKGYLKYYYMCNLLLKFSITQNQYTCSLKTQYKYSSDKSNEAFSKVMLQVLMFLLS